MNPSTDDICSAMEDINAENIFVFPNNKNIIMAAQQAKNLSFRNVHRHIVQRHFIAEALADIFTFNQSHNYLYFTDPSLRSG